MHCKCRDLASSLLRAGIFFFATFLFFSSFPDSAASLPVKGASESSALYYLLNYGYIKKDENSNTQQLLSSSGLKKAIKDFQVCHLLIRLSQLAPGVMKFTSTFRSYIVQVITRLEKG